MDRPSLEQLYFNPKIGLNSVRTFFNKVKKYGYSIDEVSDFVNNTEIGQRFKTIKKKDFLPIFCVEGGCYQSDITFFPKFSGKNNGIDKILTFINVNTKYACASPLKSTRGEEVSQVLKRFIEQAGDVEKLTTDNGVEFLNKHVQKVLNDLGVQHYLNEPGDHRKMSMLKDSIEH